MENSINCHYFTPKGCSALTYNVTEDCNVWIDGKGNFCQPTEICAKCKFKKTEIEWANLLKRKRHSDVPGLFLIFDGVNQGFFHSIIDADKWLCDYFENNKENEYIPRTALFKDYNILFTNHNIRFLIKKENEKYE